MGIYIRGLEMPKSCAGCCFTNCIIKIKQYNWSFDRPNNCPLVEVPTPHGRLGDLDALLENMKRVHDKWKMEGHYTPTTDDEIMTMNMPIIIEAEE